MLWPGTIYFLNASFTKIDYFFFDILLESYILSIDFHEDFVIGADHLPGSARVIIPGLNSPEE